MLVRPNCRHRRSPVLSVRRRGVANPQWWDGGSRDHDDIFERGESPNGGRCVCSGGAGRWPDRALAVRRATRKRGCRRWLREPQRRHVQWSDHVRRARVQRRRHRGAVQQRDTAHAVAAHRRAQQQLAEPGEHHDRSQGSLGRPERPAAADHREVELCRAGAVRPQRDAGRARPGRDPHQFGDHECRRRQRGGARPWRREPRDRHVRRQRHPHLRQRAAGHRDGGAGKRVTKAADRPEPDRERCRDRQPDPARPTLQRTDRRGRALPVGALGGAGARPLSIADGRARHVPVRHQGGVWEVRRGGGRARDVLHGGERPQPAVLAGAVQGQGGDRAARPACRTGLGVP